MTTSQKRFYQLAKKLLTPDTLLCADGHGIFVLVKNGKPMKKQLSLTADDVAAWVKADFLIHSKTGFALSETGRAHFYRHTGGDFAAQHNADREAVSQEGPRRLATTPLQCLQARGRQSAYGLNEMELEAGGRLHDDFHRAQHVPHQTMDWSRPVFVDGQTSGGGEMSDATLDAQKRVTKALAYIGPGLADMALDVCCSEIGLSAIEKKFSLPRRSAKIMLKLALMRLSVHYGYQSASAAAASFRMR